MFGQEAIGEALMSHMETRYALSDRAMGEALFEIYSMRRFTCLPRFLFAT